MDVTADAPQRYVELDVIRAVALIGVCVMNYHGYLILDGAKYPPTTFVERVFDPWQGPLSTRFAATFVTVAGMGITLLTRRSRASGNRHAISADRWKLVRRGVLLYAFGFFLNWVWDGTILFYYGAFFVAGALLFTMRIRWLVTIGAGAALAAAGLQWWAVERASSGHDTSWLLHGEATATRSPRDLLLDTFVRGTHPLLPWLVFLCMGIVLGRMMPFTAVRRMHLALTGAGLLALGYAAHEAVAWHPTLESTTPFDRGVLYTLTTVGSSLLAVSLVGAIAEATASVASTKGLAATGRTTLTLYVGHVLVYNLLVHWLEWVHPAGLATALVFAAAFWMGAVVTATAWQHWHGIGPLEWVYRRFSETAA
ncbi:MAG: DUF418 domain-containing protein [Ilumatobacteraceae bacterium]